MLAIQGVYDGVSIQKIAEKQESIPNAETTEAFKWTENYIKSGKKNGFKTTNELYKSWGQRIDFAATRLSR
jgi:hypothetical protein